MKGLLLKDGYMIKSYCKLYLVITALFLVGNISDVRNSFMMAYPCLLSSILAVMLLSFDEKSKWEIYVGTLPVSKRQIVSEKYLLCLLVNIPIWLLLWGILTLGQMINGQSAVSGMGAVMSSLISLSLFAPALMLPFVYKLGVERGRMIYLLVVILVFVLALSLIGFDVSQLDQASGQPWGWCVMLIVSVGSYLVSWQLSIRIYNKRTEK